MTTTTRSPRGGKLLVIVAVAALVVLGGGGAAYWWLAARADEPAAAASALPTASIEPTTAVEPLPAGDASSPLPEGTGMGVVELKVVNLPNVLAYYRDGVGLEVLEEGDGFAVLGLDAPVIRLDATDDPLDAATDAGLYHSAVLFADESSLAQTLARMADFAPHTYQGASDHAVSIAFYFGDPEGNGLELYVDRPREEWVWDGDRVRMGSAAVDVNAFIAEHAGAAGAGAATMGHVHLRVGDLDEARAFYEGVIGFDVTAESDGALFYSAGGYHHHLATNTWASAGAGVRDATAGLGAYTMTVPAIADVAAVAARLDAAGLVYDVVTGGLAVDDPWGNTVRVVTA
jgi:catechol 2,3-dioxygenase